MSRENSVGLIVGRFQPLHYGHCAIIEEMDKKCSRGIIALGSCDKRDSNNPFSVGERIEMIRNIYGYKFLIVTLNDIDNEEDWCKYVLTEIADQAYLSYSKESGYITSSTLPTDYFTGHKEDAVWYEKHFNDRIHVVQHDNKIHAHEIRNLILTNDDNWKQYVPTANYAISNMLKYSGKFCYTLDEEKCVRSQ